LPLVESVKQFFVQAGYKMVIRRKSSSKEKILQHNFLNSLDRKPAARQRVSAVKDNKPGGDEPSPSVKNSWKTKKKLKVAMKPPPSAKSGTTGPKKLKSGTHSKDVKKEVAKKSPAKTVTTKTTLGTTVNDDEDLGLHSLRVHKKQPAPQKSPRKTKLVVEKPIIKERNRDNEDALGLFIGKDMKEASRPFEPIIDVSKCNEATGANKAKTNPPSSTPSADDADKKNELPSGATRKPASDS
jgi:hypothetical protein